jgi:hypothetical protein
VTLEPLFGLPLRTPRPELRLGSHGDLLELGRPAKAGIHPSDEMPFAVAWTDRADEPTFVEDLAAYHEGRESD